MAVTPVSHSLALMFLNSRPAETSLVRRPLFYRFSLSVSLPTSLRQRPKRQLVTVICRHTSSFRFLGPFSTIAKRPISHYRCCFFSAVLPVFFSSTMAHHFLFIPVFSLRIDKVLQAFVDLSTAECAAVQQRDDCTVTQGQLPEYNRTFRVLQVLQT